MYIEDSIGFLNRNLLFQQKQTIDADIFTDHIKPMMKNYNNGHPCHYLQKKLVIDEYNQILICCAVLKNNVDYNVGSLLEMRIKDIISSKTLGKPICNRCMSAGVPYWYAHNTDG